MDVLADIERRHRLVGMRRSDDEKIPTLGFLGPHVEASSLRYRTVPYVRPFARVEARGSASFRITINATRVLSSRHSPLLTLFRSSLKHSSGENLREC